MILFVLELPIRTELADRFPDLVRDFADGTRAEEGNVVFELARSADRPDTYLVVQGFRDGAAAQAHIAAEHHVRFTQQASDWLAGTARILPGELAGIEGWSEVEQLRPR